MSQRRRRALAQWPAPISVRHTVCIRHFPHQELIWCSDLTRSSLSTEPECLRGFEIDDQFILGLGPRQSHRRLQQGFAAGGMGFNINLRCKNPERFLALSTFRVTAKNGGLIFYGASAIDLYRRAASYVDRVLRNENPGQLPVATTDQI